MSTPDQPPRPPSFTRPSALTPALADAVHAGVTPAVDVVFSALREGESLSAEALREKMELLLGDLLAQSLADRETIDSPERPDSMTTSGNPLELRVSTGGQRYYLDGRPVHNGDIVELLLEDGKWLPLRLEGMPRELLGYGLPRLAGGYEFIVKVPSFASFRWPEKVSR
jgi:hypothetical protein